MWDIAKQDLVHLPLYKRVIRLIEEAVEQGHLHGGERLPAERVLAKTMGVNRSTVILALENLTERGILVRKHGSGTYVNAQKWGVQGFAELHWHRAAVFRNRQATDPYRLQVAELANKAKQKGLALLDLAQDALPNDLLPDMTVPPWPWHDLIQAEQEEEGTRFGLASFRVAVQNFLRQHRGLDLPLSQILITSGSQQSIFLLTQCLLAPGDCVGVEMPSYFYSLPVFQAAGLRLCPLPMDAQGITVEGLEAVMQRRRLKLIFLNPVFHNPTGGCFGQARKAQVLEYCAAKHIPIVEDDAYGLLSFSTANNTLPLKVTGRDQVIGIGSLSSYAGSSLRAGWITAPEPVITQLAEVRQHMDARLSVLPQVLAGHYLNVIAPNHMHTLRQVLPQRAAALARLVSQQWGQALSFTLPAGGLYMYAKLHERSQAAEAAMLRNLLEQRIIVARGAEFGDAPGAFRMNFSWFVQ